MAAGVAAAAGGSASGERVDWRLAAPLGLTYLVFFAAPFAILLGISFYADAEQTRLGLDSWTKFYGDGFYLKVIFDTLKLGVFAVAATTLLAYPLALVFRASGPKLQRVLIFVILMPLLTSVVIRTFAWIVILAREGVVNQTLMGLGLTAAPLNLLQTELGLVIALTQIEMPLMLLPLLTIMNQMDQNLVDASRALGASKWRTFFKVVLPLTLPGWIAGATLVFASATTAFISQSVIGGARLVYLPALIWQQSTVVYNWPFAAVASLTLLFTVLAGIMALGWLGRFARTH
ncbi:MAG TPA: ABC transporter permease [Bosea sp. (in: a-proteobacteria)]|jgi:putative spermidine/putrescine transport system permease protein|uniref:ABC transporter permease n=1 Tax=Bosea sp. (in: a-proteobacteria) TaxID=1871050 RepID=UPI002E137CA0|nr:ABC transporter permease [Bosea sp. (in: a-proteobacteria)]